MNFQFIFSFTGQIKSVKSKATKSEDLSIEEAFEQKGQNTKYVPTTYGPMKVNLNNFLFTYHYTRNGITRYRCESFKNSKCPASILVKKKLTFPTNENHNHQQPKIDL